MTVNTRRGFLKSVGGGAVGGTALLAGCLGTDDEYPSDDIRHIIPWDSGGGTDTVGRGFVDFAEDYLDTEIFTENIPGATSGQGIGTVMDADPDGYTIGTMTFDSYVTVPYFELVDDYDLDRLRILNTFTEQPCVFVVHEDSDIDSMAELIEFAEQNPGELDMSTTGENGINHLPAIHLERAADIEFNYVHYEGGGGQSEAVGTGETEAGVPTIGLIEPVLDSVKLLGFTLQDRYDAYSDVPTVEEEVGHEIYWNSTRHIAVPAETEDERIDILKDGFREVSEDEEWEEWIMDTEGSYTWLEEEETMELISNTQEQAFEIFEELGVE